MRWRTNGARLGSILFTTLLLALGVGAPASADGPNTCQRVNFGGQFGVVVRYSQMQDPSQATLFAENGGILLRTNFTTHDCDGSTLTDTDGIQVQGTDTPNHFTLDHGGGSFGNIPIQVDLGSGADDVSVLGTAGRDVATFGIWNQPDAPGVIIAIDFGTPDDPPTNFGEVAPPFDPKEPFVAIANGDHSDVRNLRADPHEGYLMMMGEGSDTFRGSPGHAANTPVIEGMRSTAAQSAAAAGLLVRVVGGGGRDVLRGGFLDEELIGGEGDDKLVGGDGNDTLKGSAGNDKLKGGAGKDKLNAGKGKDRCNGGPGKDKERGCE